MTINLQSDNPITIEKLLDLSCGHPENQRAYDSFREELEVWRQDPTKYEKPHYDGWFLHKIAVCCQRIIVKTRRTENGREIHSWSIDREWE